MATGNTGKLYRQIDNVFISHVHYKFHNGTPTNWWGELIMTDHVKIGDELACILELEDKRRGNCRIKKRVNRAVTGVPPRYVYHFTGTSLLE